MKYNSVLEFIEKYWFFGLILLLFCMYSIFYHKAINGLSIFEFTSLEYKVKVPEEIKSIELIERKSGIGENDNYTFKVYFKNKNVDYAHFKFSEGPNVFKKNNFYVNWFALKDGYLQINIKNNEKNGYNEALSYEFFNYVLDEAQYAYKERMRFIKKANKYKKDYPIEKHIKSIELYSDKRSFNYDYKVKIFFKNKELSPAIVYIENSINFNKNDDLFIEYFTYQDGHIKNYLIDNIEKRNDRELVLLKIVDYLMMRSEEVYFERKNALEQFNKIKKEEFILVE